jgi:hypothetical protein
MTSGKIKERASVLQSKTQKPVRFEISEGTRASLDRSMQDPLMVAPNSSGQDDFTRSSISRPANMLGSSATGLHR